MSRGRFVRSSWCGLEAQHRYEDLEVIGRLLKTQAPDLLVELGTAAGGFAAFLGFQAAQWGGRVITFDRERHPAVTKLLELGLPVEFHEADLLGRFPYQWLLDTLQSARRPFLYCDNGNKTEEIRRYAPALPVGGLLGCHDYNTEVDPVWVEAFVADLGFQPYGHAEMEALADPENYPRALTRMWTRAHG